jgi:hypothetical protein
MFLASVLTLVLAIIAVMVVLKLVVVPHIQQQAHVGTVCTITGIHSLKIGVMEGNCTDLPDNTNNRSMQDVKCDRNACVQVDVMYIDISGISRLGYLRAKEHETEHVVTDDLKVGCMN